MGTIKDRNGMDLTEAEDTKKRWQECTELYTKDLNNPDNHDGVITHLEPDVLECRRPGFNPSVGKVPWRRKMAPTPVLLPGESHGGRSLVGYSPWDPKELDMTERLHFHSSLGLG